MVSSSIAAQKQFAPWLLDAREQLLEPRRRAMLAHPFLLAMQAGTAQPEDAQRYFSGLMWHLLAFGDHVAHLFSRRPAEASTVLAGQPEDKDGDTDLLARIVRAFGGPAEAIEQDPWSYRPHRVWIHHDALLRSSVYSTDLEWQVGTAALNVGIESLVPDMIEPLFRASVERYGVAPRDAAWLESRSGEVERAHGDNGFVLLSHFVDPGDIALQKRCLFYIDALSHSMAYALLESGLPEAGGGVNPVVRIVSGGQTGVDRAALDVAIALGLALGGWCPAGRWAEDGEIAPYYPLQPTPDADPAQRTAWNVRDSDGTLILAPAPLTGGTAFTLRVAQDLGRPHLVVEPPGDPALVRDWLRACNIRVLNVAGPRESTWPGAYDLSRRFLLDCLTGLPLQDPSPGPDSTGCDR